MKHTKFWLGAASLIAVTFLALKGRMDANVALVMAVINGGYSLANAAITRAALANGKDPNGTE